MSVEQELAEIEELEAVARSSSPLAQWASQEAITKRAKLQLDPATVRFAPDDVWSPHLTKGSKGQGPTLVSDYSSSQTAGSFHSPAPKGAKQCPLCGGAGSIPKKNKGPRKPSESVTSDADSLVSVD